VLAAFVVDGLGKVALAIKQGDADKRQREVARRLAVVAGEDAEPARVNRQALVKTELGAEVGDQIAVRHGPAVRAVRPMQMVAVVGRQHPVVAAEKYRIVRGGMQALLADAFQERFRAVADGVPQFGV